MSEARDRLVRSEESSTPPYRQRTTTSSNVSRSRLSFVTSNSGGDEGERRRDLFGSGVGRMSSGGTKMNPRVVVGVGVMARAGLGSSGRGLRGRSVGLFGSSMNPRVGGSRGRGRNGSGVLPSWYPRRPLGDITAIVNALERRRIRINGADRVGTLSPATQDLEIYCDVDDDSTSHSDDLATPKPSTARRSRLQLPGPIHNILLDCQGEAGDHNAWSELTPQKRLLNSIDIVEKAVMAGFQRMKRTPEAKRAERNRKVRTLMSMR